MAKNMLYDNMDASQQQIVNKLSVTQEPVTTPKSQSGYLSVQVLSETGQPIKDALVTVFHFHDNGDLHVHYNLVTDENGKAPIMDLLVKYVMPNEIDKPTYTTYNLRAYAKDYYPVNIINFRIYPGVETDYTFTLTPLPPIESGTVPEQTIVEPQREGLQFKAKDYKRRNI
jgi:hypothetical protein